MTKRTYAILYWLHDSSCVCLWRHGYIGMTIDWPHRLHRHRSESDFLPTQFSGQVLFKGSIKKCLALEQQLRPVANIGWNRYPGGRSGHAAKGIPKSPEQREKMRQAALRRYADPTEHERTSRDVKKGLKNVAPEPITVDLVNLYQKTPKRRCDRDLLIVAAIKES